jgi:hypothetical protein
MQRILWRDKFRLFCKTVVDFRQNLPKLYQQIHLDDGNYALTSRKDEF